MILACVGMSWGFGKAEAKEAKATKVEVTDAKAAKAASSSYTPIKVAPFPIVDDEFGKWTKVKGDKFLPGGINLQLSEKGKINGAYPVTEKTKGLLGSYYVVGNVDATTITPALWRAIYLEMHEDDGKLCQVELIRPLWWFEQEGAEEGKTIHIDMPEVAIVGDMKVVKIEETTCDSREKREGCQPITGRFIHEGATLIELEWENGHKLQSTPNHPFRSLDRNDWIQAQDIRPGETMATKDGSLKLKAIHPVPGLHKVYNIETYRDHTFFVGDDAMWVHNSQNYTKPTGTLASREIFTRGNKKFSLEQGDASTGWTHIYDRHVGNNPAWTDRTKFPSNWSHEDISQALNNTLKHGTESSWYNFTIYEGRFNYKGLGFRNYKATINPDGSVRTFHLMEK